LGPKAVKEFYEFLVANWHFRAFFDGMKSNFWQQRCEVREDSVKLAGDHRVLDKKLEWNDFESVLVSGFEDDRAGGTSLLDLEPTGGTDAPAVAGFEAGKAKLRHGSAQIVAERLGGFEESSVDDAADGVEAEVFGAGLAAAGAVEAGHRLAATDIKRLAEDVLATVLDWFDVGHAFYSNP
jgi:hypothetical protein